MLFSCRKYFIIDRPSRKLPSALSKNYVSIVICFCINLAEFAFVSVNSIFGQMLLFYQGFIVLVSHPDTNPAEQSLTSVNFSIAKLSDAQRAHLW